jgi:serine/threonine-protein kinase
MATVHLGRLASAHGFAKTVAIKELHETFAKNKDFVARFLDEARLVARIAHPNVMPTLDIISEDDHLRIVMEYVKGESLDKLERAASEKRERTPPRIACAVMVGVLHGLHAAHEANNEFGEPLGIVHLDVSPQNILVGTDGVARVLDFGLARAKGQRDSGEVSGKVGYMAPEQITGGEVSPRTDVFAASIVLFELLTGRPLFVGDNYAATMQHVLSGPVPSLLEVVPTLPAGLDAILKTGLSRAPGSRFGTARDMALAIERVMSLAPASEVGTWVEETCAETLSARAALVQAIEAESARAPAKVVGLVSPRELYAEQAAANVKGGSLPYEDTASLLRPPGAPDAMYPQRASDGSVRWQTKPSPGQKPPPPAYQPPSRTAKPTPLAARPKRGNRWLLVVGVVTVLFGAGVLVRILVLPGYVRDAAIRVAASQGVTLTIQEARLGSDGVVFEGLVGKLVGVPQVTVTVSSLEATVSLSAPPHVKVGPTEVAIVGDAKATAAAMGAWWTAHHSAGSVEHGPADGTQIEMPRVHLVWTSPFGTDITRIEMRDLGGGMVPSVSPRPGDEMHFTSPLVSVDTRVGRFGPWNVDLDQSVTGRRIRVAFDPAVLDAASATLLLDAHAGTTFDLTVPHLPVGRLGIPPAALGNDVPLPQLLAAKVHVKAFSGTLGPSALDVTLVGAHAPGFARPVDVHVAGETKGGPRTGSPLEAGVVQVGPFRAALTGTVALRSDGASANLAWKADPEPCASLVSLPTPADAVRDMTHQAETPGPTNLDALVRDMGALAQAVGAVKVTGTLSASGTLAVDSADPGHPAFTVIAKNACGLALFQGK